MIQRKLNYFTICSTTLFTDLLNNAFGENAQLYSSVFQSDVCSLAEDATWRGNRWKCKMFKFLLSQASPIIPMQIQRKAMNTAFSARFDGGTDGAVTCSSACNNAVANTDKKSEYYVCVSKLDILV